MKENKMNLFYNNEAGKNRTITNILSVLLSVLMFFSAFPLTALADDFNQDFETNREPVVVKELEEKRESDTKHFLMSDNTVKAVLFNEPVHYEKNGKWKDIDYSLEYEKALNENDFNGYRTKEGFFEVKFAQKANATKLLEISDDKHYLSWNLLNKSKTLSDLNKLKIEKVKKTSDIINKSVEKSSQCVRYENIISNTDLEYTVNGNGLKENIIIKKPSDNYFYTFAVTTENLKLELNTDNSIAAKDSKTGEVAYVIPSLFMYDSKGTYSNEVTVSLSEKSKNEYELAIEANEKWINSKERVFPVIIDPQITTKQIRSNIDSTYVESGHPNVNHNGEPHMMVGKDSSGYGKGRGYIKFVLPELSKGDMVVDATMHLAEYYVSYYDSTTPDAEINAYLVEASWSESTVKWNNQPTCNSTVLDFDYVKKTDTQATWKNWNITKAVKQWYEGTATNYGIMLKSALEGVSSNVGSCIYAWYYNESGATSTAYPMISITYRNNKGLESYWTYTSASAGTAGTANINDYSGNLVFSRTDCSTSGLKMPVSVEAVYNGYMAGVKYNKTKPYIGHGWKLNIQQTVTHTSITDYPYVYEDGDGTQHYFYKKTSGGTTKYLDEDGLKLELKTTSTGYTITDEKDNKLTFNSAGNLKTSEDANGNKMTVTYDSTDASMIRSVKDGSGHIIQLLENTTSGSGYLQYMVDPSGRRMHFMYTDGLLTTVEYPDGTSDTYTYNDDEELLMKATDSTGYSLSFTYSSKKSGRRVKKIVEKGGSSTGQTIGFDRTLYNTTVIQTSGVDDLYDTDDDIFTTYQFDNCGKTISTQSKTASANLGAEVYNYTSSDLDNNGSNIKTLNKVSSTAALGRNIINLAKNTNAESTSNWSLTRWVNDCTATVSATTAQKYYGAKSLKLDSTAVTGDGRARLKQDFSTSDVTPGETYTLSAYVKTSNITKVNNYSFGACVSLYAECSNSANSTTVYSEYLTGTTDTAIDNGWRKISVTLTIPSDATFTRANLAIKNATGTAYFDGIQLEKASVANSYNFVENSSMEKVTNNLPDGWRGNVLTLSDSVDGKSTAHKFGSYSFRIVGAPKSKKELVQDIAVSGNEDDTYIISGWAKANAIPPTNSDRKFKISVKVIYSDNTEVWKEPAEFNTTVSEWQYTAQAFTLSDGTSANKTPKQISIYLRFFYQSNKAYFDGIQLIKDTSQSYTYDNDGNIISVAENAEQKSNMEYSNSNLTKVTDPKGYSYNYTYDSHHNVTQAKSQNNVKYNYTYNSSGNPTELNITNNGNSMALGSTAVYSLADSANGISAGAYLSKTTDQDGNETSYSYDKLKGNLNSVTNPQGQVISYTYNSNNDLLLSVTANDVGSNNDDITNSYTYQNNRLKTINHNNMNYSFIYDSYGNVTQTKAGNNTLSTNTYGSNNGKLLQTQYGNGLTVLNSYNAYGDVTAVKRNGTTKYSWSYDSSSKPILHTDNINGLNYYYTYDTTGRLIRQNVYKQGLALNADSRYYSVEQKYDENNNVSKITQSAGTISPYQLYSYDKDNLPDVYTMFSNRKQNYTYDSLNRLKEIAFTSDTPIKVNYNYYISSKNENQSEYYRTTKIKTELIGNRAYLYSYDNLGNIISVSEGVRNGTANTGTSFSAKLSYEYDALSQLTRENNAYLDQTVTYSYDNGGNITSKAIYTYTTGSLDEVTPIETKSYSYGNTDWTDLLTSYDGQSITYDTIGNPTSYLGYSMSWSGRELESLSGNGLSVSYKYDADGLRSYKKVGNTESYYQYVGDKLLYEKRGDIEFYYYYNSFGDLAGIKYIVNGTEYMVYAFCNSRGDVEDLYWSGGNLACHYTYDSWGNVISVVNASGNEITDQNNIANMNPIRYRGYYYDSETGYYYLKSRYYNPQVSRFISSDAYFSTGEGINSCNMFAYCGNNPINLADPNGYFWKEIGNWCKKVWNGVKTWVKGTFGASYSKKSTVTTYENAILPEPSPIVIKGGNRITSVEYTQGDSSKPISVYSNIDTLNPVIASNAGITANFRCFSVGTNLAVNNTSNSLSIRNHNTTNSYSIKIDLTRLSLGLEVSQSTVAWDKNIKIIETDYSSFEVSFLLIVAAYEFVRSGGAYFPTPQPAPQPAY